MLGLASLLVQRFKRASMPLLFTRDSTIVAKSLHDHAPLPEGQQVGKVRHRLGGSPTESEGSQFGARDVTPQYNGS